MPKLFIWGGCVGRDTYSRMGPDWTLTEYVARQSWISAATGAAELVGDVDLQSAFQRKCLERDIQGNALEIFAGHISTTDVVVLDLLAERTGILRTPNGAYVTQSWELEQSNLVAQQPSTLPAVEFGIDSHFALWTDAAELVLAAIRNAGVPYVILAPEWARTTASGMSHPKLETYRGRPVTWFNSAFERYYAWLEAEGHPVVRLDDQLARADVDHQWGLAPFHFTEQAYRHFGEHIKNAAGKSRLASGH